MLTLNNACKHRVMNLSRNIMRSQIDLASIVHKYVQCGVIKPLMT